MDNIKIDFKNTFITNEELNSIKDKALSAQEKLHNKTGIGNNFLGWFDWPVNYDKNEYNDIKNTAEYIKNNCEVLIVIGIGGSYLGAKAAIEALKGSFYNELNNQLPQIYFAGNNISGRYLKRLLQVIGNKDICVNLISKSGTTTEPAIAFRIFKELLENKYGKVEASKRIFVTTDKEKGALKKLADKEQYKTFVIPNNIGGRYSVFTPVGLLPMAIVGIDIDEIMKGITDAFTEFKIDDFEKNICCQYASIRNILYKKDKHIEIFVNYEPALSYISEWLKQLFAESEGKDGKGLFPTCVNNTTDLHSMGQYIQNGRRNIFETVLMIEKNNDDIIVPKDENDLDNLNYLSGKKMSYINNKAFQGTLIAHVNGKVPNIIISVPKLNEYFIGKLFYFFMKSCAISGYMLGINPFNQPGVEDYKSNMFALLGKP